MGELRRRTADTKPTKNNTMLEIAARNMRRIERNSKSLLLHGISLTLPEAAQSLAKPGEEPVARQLSVSNSKHRLGKECRARSRCHTRTCYRLVHANNHCHR